MRFLVTDVLLTFPLLLIEISSSVRIPVTDVLLILPLPLIEMSSSMRIPDTDVLPMFHLPLIELSSSAFTNSSQISILSVSPEHQNDRSNRIGL